MNIDFVRGASAYLVAALVLLIIVVGIMAMMLLGIVAPEVGLTPLVGIAGAAGGFMWAAESNKAGAKQAERNIMQTPPDQPPPA